MQGVGGSWPSSIGSTWKLVRTSESQLPLHTCWISGIPRWLVYLQFQEALSWALNTLWKWLIKRKDSCAHHCLHLSLRERWTLLVLWNTAEHDFSQGGLSRSEDKRRLKVKGNHPRISGPSPPMDSSLCKRKDGQPINWGRGDTRDPEMLQSHFRRLKGLLASYYELQLAAHSQPSP